MYPDATMTAAWRDATAKCGDRWRHGMLHARLQNHLVLVVQYGVGRDASPVDDAHLHDETTDALLSAKSSATSRRLESDVKEFQCTVRPAV
jgi:hypothetical protein